MTMSLTSCVVLLALLILHHHQSSAFLLGRIGSKPKHRVSSMLLSESSQDDANMAGTYASLADRLISRYERQLAANELQNNQLFVGE